MASERTFLVAMALAQVIGLAIMLYGVLLTAGQEMNAIMIAGGVVVLVPFSVMVYWTAKLPGQGEESHA